MRDLAASWAKTLTLKTLNSDARVIELSGGNQQKVVIAKALVQKPKLIIFDEPTRGVDVGAIAEIHHLISTLADDGLAVILISSYLPEILSLSDRILVSRQGRIVEELSPGEATSEAVMFAPSSAPRLEVLRIVERLVADAGDLDRIGLAEILDLSLRPSWQ